jgi:hypothetical protein
MALRLPYKDDYDPAPYNALGDELRNGGDVRQRVADLIVSTRTRPGFMAKRLNRAGIPAPHGGAWTWIDVRDAKDREILAQASRGNFLRSVPHGGCVMRVGRNGSWGRPWG